VKTMKPHFKNDFVYHVVITELMDPVLALRTIKATRIQLGRIRNQYGTGLSSYELPNGLRIEFDLSKSLDAFMYDYLSRNDHYEREVESILSKLVTKETTFIDVGANIGYFTVFCSPLAKTVYAFEPVRGTFERLSNNINLNHLENVRAFQLAVSRERTRLRFFESKISPGHNSTVRRFEHDRSTFVEAVTLDETVEPSGGNIVMKVDVEGSEMDVILGAMGLIRSGRVSAIVVEWARALYSRVSDLEERFALYSALGSVEVLDDRVGNYRVQQRHQIPDFCNLLIRIQR